MKMIAADLQMRKSTPNPQNDNLINNYKEKKFNVKSRIIPLFLNYLT
jgi:hypothetical protein